ncbi:hypothetical protein [Ascidiimonas sp. W6]|uniref:hypothetical protein n=1 Tax=Ascidiimonas meishanensis TaxID=3128903 RepID=UPI0030EF1ADC
MKRKSLKNLKLNVRKVANLKATNSISGGTLRVCNAETVIICPGPDTNGGCDSYETNCFSCGIC